MTITKRSSGTSCALILILISLAVGFIAVPVSAADAYYDGYLGDVVDIHGVSYVGNQVFLFMTGPNLAAGGVTLSDPTQRADQGHFTIITVGTDYQWTYQWDTQRIKSLIDPGTYTVYVTTTPVDVAHLGGTSTYKTLDVYLADTHAPQGESGPGTYTLNPEKHSSPSMALPTIVVGTANATPVVTPAAINTTILATSTITPAITPTTTPIPNATQAALSPATVVVAIIAFICISVRRSQPK